MKRHTKMSDCAAGGAQSAPGCDASPTVSGQVSCACQTNATEAEVRNIRQQLVLVEQIIEAVNVAKSDAELSAAMQRVVTLTAL